MVERSLGGGDVTGGAGASSTGEVEPDGEALAESLPPSTRKVLAATGLLAVVEAGGFQPSGGNTALWGGEGRRDDFAGGAIGRYARRYPRDVAFHEALRERVHPVHPVGSRVRQEGARKPAAQPEPVGTPGPHLEQGESAHSDESDPARQSFGHALHKVGRGAAEKREDGLPVRIVAQGPQDLEDLRHSLHLVQHYEPPAAAQNPFRCEAERLPVARLLQIEVLGRALDQRYAAVHREMRSLFYTVGMAA